MCDVPPSPQNSPQPTETQRVKISHDSLRTKRTHQRKYSERVSRWYSRWMSVWGLVGALLLWVYYLLMLFGVNQSFYVILFFPIAVEEMVFAVWLIVKGFDTSALE